MIDLYLGREIETKYASILSEFAAKPEFQWTVLEALPDVIKAYNVHNKVGQIQPTISALMMQEEQSFVTALFKCLAKTASKVFVNKDDMVGDEEQKGMGPIANPFTMQTIDWIKGRWNIVKELGRREMCKFIEIIPQFQESFPVLEYNDYFLNEMATIIKSGSKEAKRLASGTFCLLFLKNYISASRVNALTKILALSKSTTCFERLGLLNFIEVAAQHFSRRFLAEQGLIKAYLSLGEDKVANVRIKFAAMSRKIVRRMSSDEDRKQLLLMLTLCENNKDKDVRKLAKEAGMEVKQYVIKKTDEEDAGREKREQELLIREKQVRSYLLYAVVTMNIGGGEEEKN
jgi:hypothetical protein